MKRFTYFLFIVLAFCSLHAKSSHEMIIFVHGTLRPVEFSFSSLIKIMRNKIDNTLYCQASKYIRNDPYFFQGQPIQELGLKKIDEHTTSNACLCMVDMYETQFKFFKSPTKRHYYTFGWDGLLNVRKRYAAGKQFYKELAQEVKKLRSQGIDPEINIVAYSHGANVALNMAAVQQDDPSLDPNAFRIHRLVMLGAPIQRATDYLISHPLFENVFNIYSSEDNVQGLDIFAPRQFFSDKRFSNRSRFKIPQKLMQIRIRTVKSIKGLDKIDDPSLKPYQMLKHKDIRLIHKDPGHTELWNFKWGAYWYRDTFPLNPLPVAAFAPAIIHGVTTYAPKRRNITFDYSLSQAGAVLVPKFKRASTCIPVLNDQTTQKFFASAQRFTPEDFSIEGQTRRAKAVLQKVRKKQKNRKLSTRSRRLLFSDLHKKRTHALPE